MSNDYAKFILGIQEAMLISALPSDKAEHRPARTRTVHDLAEVVVDIVAELKPDVCLEIGAHAADFSRRIKPRLPTARAVAFEANPKVVARFKKQAEEMGIEYLHQCIADKDTKLKFQVPGTDHEYASMGSILTYKELDSVATYEVDAVRLDNFSNVSSKRNVMWIDVEGAIGQILDGGPKALTNCVALFAELEGQKRWEGQILDMEVVDRLATVGLVPILRDIQRHRWQHNILFVRESELANRNILRICAAYWQRNINAAVAKEASAETKRKAAGLIAMMPH
ncbi:FkbM family methyltransferase [Rhizobium sp. NTR19]|uniref:FkbM family methyltransferase n=1 Tax=Neorhizobium turbinariae TaxID=2937795 RepID=A0ABT0ITB5_9HYPH|nr:FkbM family methyltransferase [Neorhizobium turbinariae]MCK8781120.1 FkbM family methyltransferase [Neorhizobium turbinariae]